MVRIYPGHGRVARDCRNMEIESRIELCVRRKWRNKVVSQQRSHGNKEGFLVGAYAAAPPVNNFYGSHKEDAFYAGLRGDELIAGLEIPFTGHLHEGGVARLSDLMGEGWRIVVTALPGQMQKMVQDPVFGLASCDENGRKKSIDFIYILGRELQEMRRLRPDLKVQAIEVHSGPRPGAGVQVSPEALQRSLEELCREDHLRELLIIEHCDAWSDKHEAVKGFLPLEQELEVVKELGLAMSINWGRSAIEARSIHEPLRHIRLLSERECLRGVLFSGVAQGSELYGTWADSHAPFYEAMNEGDHEGLLLTSEEAQQCLSLIDSDVFVGLKVQALPKEMSVEQRLDFIRRNLRALARASHAAEVR